MKPTIKVSLEDVLLRDEYESGRSMLDEEKDYVFYYSYAADNGDLESLVAMGAIYLDGNIAGLSRDYDKAFYYFSEAAETQVCR
jgi:TPR repeat protein